jgi:hypothetical protein
MGLFGERDYVTFLNRFKLASIEGKALCCGICKGCYVTFLSRSKLLLIEGGRGNDAVGSDSDPRRTRLSARMPLQASLYITHFTLASRTSASVLLFSEPLCSADSEQRLLLYHNQKKCKSAAWEQYKW